MIRVARTYAETGDSDKRLGNALKAVKLLERLIETNPDNLQYVDDLASGMEEIYGNGYMVRGDLSAAQASFLNARSIRSRLISSPSGHRDLSVTYNRIGDVLMAQGKLAEALKSYRDSLAIAERLAKADPGNAGWQRDLSVLQQRRRRAGGAGQSRRGAEILSRQPRHPERLAKADPGNAGWQRDLSRRLQQGRRRAGGAGQSRRGAEILPGQPRHRRAPGQGRSRQCRLAARSLGRPTARSATCWWRRAISPRR